MSAPAERPIDVLLEGGHALRGVLEATRQIDRDRDEARFDAGPSHVVVRADRVVAYVPHRPDPGLAERPATRLDELLDDAEWDAIERLGADLRACARRAGGAEADVQTALARASLRELLAAEHPRASVLADLLDRLVVAREEERRDA